MEKGKLDNILSIIKGIEKKYSEFQRYLSKVKMLSRNKMLKEISYDIIKNNKLFQELRIEGKDISGSIEGVENLSNHNFIEELILKIQNNPTKKIIFLREFLNKMEEISDNDRIVVLQSLNDEKLNIKELKEKLVSLTNIFKLKI